MPLHATLRESKEEAAMFLTEKGCDPTKIEPRGRVPMHAALRSGLTDVIEEVLKRYVDIRVESGPVDSVTLLRQNRYRRLNRC